MKKMLSMVLAGVLLPIAVHAGCPPLDKVTFRCINVGDKQHCAWTADWYEGYQGTVNPGEHPTQFVEAFWHVVQHDTRDIGFVDCFYRDRTGELATLSQNIWGGVQLPTDANLWHEGQWPGDPLEGLVCTTSPEACTFNYPK